MAAPMRLSVRCQNFVILPNVGAIRPKLRPVIHKAENLIKRNASSKSFINRGGFNGVKARSVCLLTAGLGLTAYVTDLCRRAKPVVLAADEDKSIPKFKVTRNIKSSTDTTGLKLTLYQYQTCPFCCKVRAYLDYHGFSYDVIEVNSVWRTQTKWSKYKKVPILVCHGMGEDGYLQLNDSSVIMSILETYKVDQNQPLDKILTYYPGLETRNERGKNVIEFPNKYFVMYQDQVNLPSTAEKRNEERQWRQWTDDVLVHTLSPNIYRTMGEAVQAFNYFSTVGEWEKTFSIPERLLVIYVGSVAMYFIGKMLKKRHKLDDDVRQSLYNSCKQWTKAIGKTSKFMGGKQPNMADLSVYGVLSSIEGCRSFQDLLNNSTIGSWYYETKAVVEERSGIRCD